MGRGEGSGREEGGEGKEREEGGERERGWWGGVGLVCETTQAAALLTVTMKKIFMTWTRLGLR